MARRATGVSEKRRRFIAVGFSTVCARGPYVLSIEGSGTVRRLRSRFATDAVPAKILPACVIRFTKDTPAIRRIAPRNEFVMFMGLRSFQRSASRHEELNGSGSLRVV